MKTMLSIFALLIFSVLVRAQNNYPIPPVLSGHLFYLQHSRNTNTIVYELNLENGQPDSDKPVHPYWMRYADGGKRKELSSIQRNFAYGISSEKISSDHFKIAIVANKKRVFDLQRGDDGNFHVFTVINNKRAILTSIFVNIYGGSAWSPKVDYIYLKGLDAVTKAPVIEKVKIN